ncbi:MAG: hypothetical protein VYB89_11100, partial [Pseudomonadota bacterium]|nr:hypothetical protein [Pseudomonadota bacterium]
MFETPAKATPAAPDQGADTTTDAATEPGAPVKTRRFPWVRVGIALTLVGLVAAAASLDHWRGPARATLAKMGVTLPAFLAAAPEGPSLETQITALEARLEALTAAVTDTRAAGAPAAATRDALDQLRAADTAAARARAEQAAETATKSGTLTRDLAAQVTARLDALEDRLATLERAAPASVPAAPAPPPANLAPLRAADAALAEELDALRAESAERAQALAAIEAAVAAATTHAADDAGALLAANLLARAVTAGVPFDAELASIAARDLPASDRQSLAAVAANGVVSGAVLARRFEKLAPALVAAAPAPQGDGWWDTARARLTGLVAIRRVDGAGDDVAGRVARAEQALA